MVLHKIKDLKTVTVKLNVDKNRSILVPHADAHTL